MVHEIKRLLPSLFVAFVTTACGGENHTLGSRASSDQLTIVDTVDGGAAEADASVLRDCFLQDARVTTRVQSFWSASAIGNSYVGTWRGRMRGVSDVGVSRLADEDVHLTLSSDGTGSLRFGDVVDRPPPMAAEKGYLCDETREEQCGDLRLLQGFRYSLANSRVESSWLRFVLPSSQPWEPWCRLLAPQEWDECLFTAKPRHQYGVVSPDYCAIGPTEDELNKIDCDFLALATTNICACTSTGCEAGTEGFDVKLAISEDALTMSGTFETLKIQFERIAQ